MHRQTTTIILLAIAALLASGCERRQQTSTGAEEPGAGTAAAAVDGARILAADAEPHNWMAHGRTYDEQRFSPLDQINPDTIAELGLVVVL